MEFAMLTNDDKEIRSSENSLRLLSYNLNSLKSEMDNEIKRISIDPEIDIRASLLSINLINVRKYE